MIPVRRPAAPRPARRPSRRQPRRRPETAPSGGNAVFPALACWALSRQGLAAARALAALLAETPWAPPGGDADVNACNLFAPARLCAPESAAAQGGDFRDADFRPFARFSAALARNYRRHRGHVVIGAAGVAVRALAPLLRHKSEDPPVVVLDAAGRFAVSLLSGHWGGGNDLARHLGRLLRAQPVITTASDAAPGAPPALDILARDAGLRILDWERLPRVAAALLEGEPVPLFDPCACLSGAHAPRFQRVAAEELPAAGEVPLVAVHWERRAPAPGLLRLAARRLHAGVGCRRGTDARAILAALARTLEEHGLEPAALASLSTVTEKTDEPGMAEAARRLGVPLLAFAAPQLAAVPAPHPSRAAGRRFGLPPFSVCEAAALLAAQQAAPAAATVLLAPKTVFAGLVTVAVALSAAPGEGGAS